MHTVIRYIFVCILTVFSLSGDVWNNPHSKDKSASNTLFSSFSLSPKRLDPVVSYSANEWAFIGQIYEPPLQYNYLHKPYKLEPLTLKKMPAIRYLDKEGREVDKSDVNVALSEYRLELREDVRFQNHPAFVKDNKGNLLYGALNDEALEKIETLFDFDKVSTRYLRAEDYAYAIKRMGVRQNNSPVLDSMLGYIVGLDAYSKEITRIAKEKKARGERLDLRAYAIDGVKVIDEYTLVIEIKGIYPQFLYWLTMNFFAPIPWEADLFYQQKGLIAKNLKIFCILKS